MAPQCAEGKLENMDDNLAKQDALPEETFIGKTSEVKEKIMPELAFIEKESRIRSANPIKILVVDDESAIRKMLTHLLEKEGYDCVTAENAGSAIRYLSAHSVDMVISDVSMPGKTGIELLKHIKINFPTIATIIMTGVGSQNIAETAISMGAYGYLYKPFQKRQVLANISDALRRRSMDLQSQFEMEHLEQIIDENKRDLSTFNDKITKILESIIRAMSMAIESRDPYTAGHQHRVGRLAAVVASEMGFSEEQTQYIRMAGIIHDLGKISVPAEILSKPGRLTESEMNIIKDHPRIGYQILKEIEFPYPLAQIVYQHHERIDGSGYPQGLTGDEILPESKILAVADVVEAMMSHRPYRPSLGIEAALGEIKKHRGVCFDPAAVDACCRVFSNDSFQFE